MEPRHVVSAQIRQFPCTKDGEMGIQHRPIIAAGTFPRRMPFQILLAQVPKRRLMDLILSDLCRIGTLRDRAYVPRRQLAGLVHSERAIRPDREAAHPSPDALFQDE
jgi:hypothetical protein